VINLEEIKRCNERLKELIAEEIDESALMSILDKRKELMSKKRERYTDREVLSDVIVCRCGDVMLGFPVTFVKEVRKNYSVPLAHSNEIVVGLFQARGQVHTLVDILPMVGQTKADRSALKSPYIVHLSFDTRDIGVVVDELEGCRTLYKDELTSGRDEQNGIISSISKDLVSVIDVKAVFSSSAIVLNRSGGVT